MSATHKRALIDLLVGAGHDGAAVGLQLESFDRDSQLPPLASSPESMVDFIKRYARELGPKDKKDVERRTDASVSQSVDGEPVLDLHVIGASTIPVRDLPAIRDLWTELLCARNQIHVYCLISEGMEAAEIEENAQQFRLIEDSVARRGGLDTAGYINNYAIIEAGGELQPPGVAETTTTTALRRYQELVASSACSESRLARFHPAVRARDLPQKLVGSLRSYDNKFSTIECTIPRDATRRPFVSVYLPAAKAKVDGNPRPVFIFMDTKLGMEIQFTVRELNRLLTQKTHRNDWRTRHGIESVSPLRETERPSSMGSGRRRGIDEG
jgi:hypothetical protein